MRKPPARVTAIKGALNPKPVTQSELSQLEDMQRIAWRAHRDAIETALEIQRRITIGAHVEPGRLYFDTALGLARSRKNEKVG